VILKVEKGSKGPVVILSRTHPDLVRRLFEVEVPEIYEKIVQIVNVVREPGMRTKLSVISNNPKVDPVGACVGVKGARVKPIIDELHGERIDLIPHTTDIEKFMSSALSPAKVIKVNIISKEDKRAEVLVMDDQLSLAIGKNGHNVRLAAKLVGYHIDIKSESQKKQEHIEKNEATAETLHQLEGVGQKTADILVKGGFGNIDKLATSTVENLTTLQGIGEKTAEKIIESAKKLVSSGQQKEVKDGTEKK